MPYGGDRKRCAGGNADRSSEAATGDRARAPRAPVELRPAAPAGGRPAGIARHAARPALRAGAGGGDAAPPRLPGLAGAGVQGQAHRGAGRRVAAPGPFGRHDASNRMAHLRWLARKIGKPGIVRKDNASSTASDRGRTSLRIGARPRGERLQPKHDLRWLRRDPACAI